MARRKTAEPATAPIRSATIIPFPAYRQTAAARAGSLRASPEFDAGFEFAMLLVKGLKARGVWNGGASC